MPTAPILNLGARWKAQDVYWNSAPKNAKLLGASAKYGPRANFVYQSGIYVLYANFTPIYVGQANQSLFVRLKEHHLRDDFVGRWDRFSWFGFRRVIGGDNPRLSVPGVNFSISTKQLLNHLEAIMIHGFEPTLNGQDGRFGESVVRFDQIRDERLGPDDRDLIEMIATKTEALPKGMRITKTGWKSED